MRHVLLRTALLPSLLVALGAGCGGSSSETRHAENALTRSEAAEDASDLPPAPPQPQFVVVAVTTPLHFAPDEGSALLRFRTSDEEAARHQKLRARALKATEKEQKRFAKEIEREKKRLKRIKDPEEREAYVQKRRKSRARRFLKSIRKRSRRSGELPPERRYTVLRLLEDHGEWLEVENLHHEEGLKHCYQGSMKELEGLRLRLFVKRSDVEEVSERRQRFGVWRGTEVKLAAGVVVESDGENRLAHVDGFRLPLRISDDAVTTAYETSTLFEAPFTDTVFTDVSLAEGRLQLAKDRPLPFNPHRDLYITGTMWVGKRFYVTTQTRCGEYTVLASEEDLEPAGRRGTLRLGSDTRSAEPPYIDAGTTLYTPEGSEVGIAEKAYGVRGEVDPIEGRRCFETRVWKPRRRRKDGDPTRRFIFCVDSDAVVDVR